MTKNSGVEASIREDVGEDADIHMTTEPEEVFYTNRAKLELALINYDKAIRSRYRWTNSFVIFITALSVVLVADFQQYVGVPTEFWFSLFSLIMVVSLGYSIREGTKWYYRKDKASTEAVIRKLRKDD